MLETIQDSQPFYAPQGMHAELENQFSVVPPQLREQYRKLELAASSAFLSIYGQYLSDEQKQHYEQVNTVFVEPSTLDDIHSSLDEGICTIDATESAIDGTIYTGYTTGRHRTQEAQDIVKGEVSAVQTWAGRLALFPLANDEIHLVDSKWLMSEKKLFEQTKTMTFAEEWASLAPFIYSNEIGQVLVHEKVHGVQDPLLPLPILEASAHYYERAVAHKNDWNYNKDNNMQLLADLYGQCVEEFGDDVHRLVFGNLDPAKHDEVSAKLKSRFTPQVIKALSEKGLESYQIHWQTSDS